MRSPAGQALTLAVDLLRFPSKVRALRCAPLPPGILLLLRLAADEADARLEAGEMHKRAVAAHRDAAIFFIEQVLLASNSDSYRMLGLDKSAGNAELRRHMVYLLKWLHPDRHGDAHKAHLARRVLLAWNDIRAANRAASGRADAERESGSRSSLRKRPHISERASRNVLLAKVGFHGRPRRRLWPL